MPASVIELLVVKIFWFILSNPPLPEAVKLTPPSAIIPFKVPISSVNAVTVNGLPALLITDIVPGMAAAIFCC